MENRILIIGDELFGEQGEVASRCAEMLLCRAPSRPMQFSINAPTPLSIPQLIQRAASDIIGKKAGRIVLGLGLRDLRKETCDGAKTAENYGDLLRELVNKTQSGIMVVTIPPDYLPDPPPVPRPREGVRFCRPCGKLQGKAARKGQVRPQPVFGRRQTHLFVHNLAVAVPRRLYIERD